jgi:hypothetical protein
MAAGYVRTDQYFTTATVLCVGDLGGVKVAVVDDGGLALGTQICRQLATGAFPSAGAP